MAENMKQYIHEQPTVWQRILNNRHSIYTTMETVCQTLARQPKKLLLVGSGSSCNAALCAQRFIEDNLGLETIVTTSTGAIAKSTLLSPDNTLALVSSQSGQSTNTAAAVDALRAKGFPVVALTSDEASPVAKRANAHVRIACGPETVPPKTKGMTATTLTLYLAGVGVAKQKDPPNRQGQANQAEAALLRQLESAIQNAPHNIALSMAFCEVHGDRFACQPHFTFVSDGAGFPAAMEDALKVLETLYVPAFAYEFEEYLHGVNNTIAPGCAHFLLPTHTESLPRMLRLAKYSQAKGCENWLISALDIPEGPHSLRLASGGSPYAAPFESMLFFQILSAVISEKKGIDCDHPKFPDFYELMATKAKQ